MLCQYFIYAFQLLRIYCLQIRRLKEHVLSHLPPKRRQIIRLLLKKSDIASAKTALRAYNANDSICEAATDISLEKSDQSDGDLC